VVVVDLVDLGCRGIGELAERNVGRQGRGVGDEREREANGAARIGEQHVGESLTEP